jgi:hypothetical protein
MISAKFSTNPVTLNEFERGRRNDPVISGGMTQISFQFSKFFAANRRLSMYTQSQNVQ